jgi:hypothetical protein
MIPDAAMFLHELVEGQHEFDVDLAVAGPSSHKTAQ